MNAWESVSLGTGTDELLGRVDMPPVRKSISAGAEYRVGNVMERLWKFLPGEPPMTRFVASQLAGSHSYSIGAAERDFGYAPVCTMAEGMQRLQADLLKSTTEA